MLAHLIHCLYLHHTKSATPFWLILRCYERMLTFGKAAPVEGRRGGVDSGGTRQVSASWRGLVQGREAAGGAQRLVAQARLLQLRLEAGRALHAPRRPRLL